MDFITSQGNNDTVISGGLLLYTFGPKTKKRSITAFFLPATVGRWTNRYG
jgi:hypothetical protein